MKKVLVAAALLTAGMAFAQKNVSITWLTGNTAQAIQYSKAAAQRYQSANPHTINGQDYNVTVNVQQGPESTTDRYALYLQLFEAQSSDADLLEIDVIWPGDLQQHLIDFNQYDGVADDMKAFFQPIVENNTVDGKLVGIPYFTDAGLLYYRTDLLKKYGYDNPPKTWTELQEMATKIMEGEGANNPDFTGYVWQGDAYEGLTCDALEWISSFGGGSIISPEGQIEVYNDQTIAALDAAAGWVGTISPRAVTGFQEEDARQIFQNGNAVFMRNWPYAYSLATADDSPIADSVGITTLPAGQDGSPAATLGGWQLAVNKYSKNPDVAVDVARFMTSYDEQLTHAIATAALPTIEAVYQDQKLLDSNVSWFADLLPVFQNAVARPSTVTAPRYAQVSKAFFTAVHDVLTGANDADTAMGELEIDLEDLTGLKAAAHSGVEVATK